jgi:hypothetical protein
MPLPPKPFHTLAEIAARWQMDSLAIVGWAIEGLISLSAALAQLETADGDRISGLLGIAGEDIFALFDGEPVVHIHRFRKDPKAAWENIAIPASGVPVRAAGVVITRAEVERFERAHRLFQSDPWEEGRPRFSKQRAGAPERYDWGAFTGAVARRVLDHGLPASQSELVRDMLDWFATIHGATPDESTVRRRVQSAWRELTRPG